MHEQLLIIPLSCRLYLKEIRKFLVYYRMDSHLHSTEKPILSTLLQIAKPVFEQPRAILKLFVQYKNVCYD